MPDDDRDADVEAVCLAWTKAHNLFLKVSSDDADQDDLVEFAARRVLDDLVKRGWRRPGVGE